MTLYRYIFKEIWPTFIASLFVFIFIMMAARMLSITELIVTRGVHASEVAGMVLFLLPDILTFALPAVTLMSVVVAFLRLSADSEIIAMKSSGISLYQMLPPVVLFSLMAFLGCLAISAFAAPWGNRSFKDMLFKIAQNQADLGIKERVFCEPFGNLVLYVNEFSRRERVLKDVFVVDRRDQEMTNTIISDEARIIMRPNERTITLLFVKGTIFLVEKNLQSSRTIKFNTYALNIGLKDVLADLASRPKAPHELTPVQLIEKLKGLPRNNKDYSRVMRELLEKLTIPLAVFFMGIIGVPLGAQIRGRGRTTGIGISLVVFALFYLFLMIVRSVCSTGAVPPVLGVWAPDFFLLMATIYLLRRASREKPIRLKLSFFKKRTTKIAKSL